ncbi:type II restriction endonuclease [Streptomyces sp. NPDC015242]|uniref:type II restriction endonuclease n=1 Tax=Streptomyces sp. NPDC015242 TaxID=3364951 RepID=UPI0036F6E92A
MTGADTIEEWLRNVCSQYKFDVRGALQTDSPDAEWPITITDPQDLEEKLAARGHLLPLPKEPASLANIIEVSIIDFILAAITGTSGIEFQRGSERGYPDLEVSGPRFGGGHHAIDIKAARRAVTKGGVPNGRTQSRITLYTGNTYFKWPALHWPGTFRPFGDYETHLDVLVIYTLNEASAWRVDDLEVIVQEPWRIASKKRSSTTREYIGAVDSIAALREGRGEFNTPEEFYRFWRAFQFKISAQVSNQLNKLMTAQQAEIDRLRGASQGGSGTSQG